MLYQGKTSEEFSLLTFQFTFC